MSPYPYEKSFDLAGSQKGLENPRGTLAALARSPGLAVSPHNPSASSCLSEVSPHQRPCTKALLTVRHGNFQPLSWVRKKKLFYFFVPFYKKNPGIVVLASKTGWERVIISISPLHVRAIQENAGLTKTAQKKRFPFFPLTAVVQTD